MEFTQATFLASLPPIQSAVMKSGRGNGLVIKLDVAEVDTYKAFRVQLWEKLPIEVTVRVLDNELAARCLEINGREELCFIARISDTDDAVMRSGNGDGLRIKLLVPHEEVAQAIWIELWTQKHLEVSMRVLDGQALDGQADEQNTQDQDQDSNQKPGGGQSLQDLWGQTFGGKNTHSPRRSSAKQRVRRGDSSVQ